jgi:hypothetical protein
MWIAFLASGRIFKQYVTAWLIKGRANEGREFDVWSLLACLNLITELLLVGTKESRGLMRACYSSLTFRFRDM